MDMTPLQFAEERLQIARNERTKLITEQTEITTKLAVMTGHIGDLEDIVAAMKALAEKEAERFRTGAKDNNASPPMRLA